MYINAIHFVKLKYFELCIVPISKDYTTKYYLKTHAVLEHVICSKKQTVSDKYFHDKI